MRTVQKRMASRKQTVTRMISSSRGVKALPLPRVLVYTYGAPRVGNRAFASWVNRQVPSMFRVEVDGDLVCRLPHVMYTCGECEWAYHRYLFTMPSYVSLRAVWLSVPSLFHPHLYFKYWFTSLYICWLLTLTGSYHHAGTHVLIAADHTGNLMINPNVVEKQFLRRGMTTFM